MNSVSTFAPKSFCLDIQLYYSNLDFQSYMKYTRLFSLVNMQPMFQVH